MDTPKKASKEFKLRIKAVHDDHAAATGRDEQSFAHLVSRAVVHLDMRRRLGQTGKARKKGAKKGRRK